MDAYGLPRGQTGGAGVRLLPGQGLIERRTEAGGTGGRGGADRGEGGGSRALSPKTRSGRKVCIKRPGRFGQN